MTKLHIIASLAIDHISNYIRCGGSALYSPIPLYLLDINFNLHYVSSKKYPFKIPFEGHHLPVEKDFEFELRYHNDERDLFLVSYPIQTPKIEYTWSASDTVIVNPLFKEFTLEIISEIVKRSKVSAFDLQGYLRFRKSDGMIVHTEKVPREYKRILENATIIKVGIEEYKSWEPFGEIFVITKGSKGCDLYINEEHYHVPSIKVDKIAVGAGDMFISYFAHCYAHKNNAIDCAVESNALVSSIIELLEFSNMGCVTREQLDGIKTEVRELWKKRIELIRSQL